MRMHFREIFSENEGRFTPRFHINIGDVAIAAGVPISEKMAVGGVRLGKLIDCDLVVENVDGLMDIQGFYQDETEKSRVVNNGA